MGSGPASLERRRTQNDVEAVAERPLRPCQLEVEAGHEPVAGLLVAHGPEDRIELEQRIARKIHLRDQSARERTAEDGEVDVRRPPRVGMVLPGIRAGLYGHELVASVMVRNRPAGAAEVRIEWGGMLVALVPVASAGVRLPDLDECVAYRTTVLLEQPAGHDDSF